MNEEHKYEEAQKYAGSTAVALADANERAALKADLEHRPNETELQRESDDGGTSTLIDKGVAPAGAAPALAMDDQAAPLFSTDETKELRGRWDAIQGGFVDEPRRAVEQADRLVTEAMKRLAEMFADERIKLEGQWDREEGVSTEHLRIALRRYRSFFGRLLSV